MSLTERVKNILLRPKQEWEVIAQETTTTTDLYKNYIILLAAIGPIASVIGMSIIGISLSFMGSYRVPILNAIATAVVSYILGLVGVYVVAWLIDYLAPTFSAEKNMNQAMKLAAYSFTAGWLASIFAIIPALAILSILGLYSIYLLYTGLPILMKSPPEKSVAYTAAVIVISIVVFIVISLIPRAFISYPTAGMHMGGVSNEATQEIKKAATEMEKAAKKIQEGVAKTGPMTEEQLKQIQDTARNFQKEMEKRKQAEK